MNVFGKDRIQRAGLASAASYQDPVISVLWRAVAAGDEYAEQYKRQQEAGESQGLSP